MQLRYSLDHLTVLPTTPPEVVYVAAETGLSVSDIELVRILPDMNPHDYEDGFAAGAELGAKDVTASIWTPDAGYALDMFDAVCAIARRYELRVNLEFVAIAAVRTLRE